MSEEKQLVTSIVEDEGPRSLAESPQEVANRGSEQAKMLMELVKSGGKTWVSKIKGNDFLKFEAWQTIARFNRCSPRIDWVKEIHDEQGRIAAYEARAEVVNIDTGVVVGSAEAVCGMDEHVTQGQSGYGKQNAAKSMAQTRAGSKAMRMTFSFVAVMAGYQPTPEEEMQFAVRDVSEAPQRVEDAPATMSRGAMLNALAEVVKRLDFDEATLNDLRNDVRKASNERLAEILSNLKAQADV